MLYVQVGVPLSACLSRSAFRMAFRWPLGWHADCICVLCVFCVQLGPVMEDFYDQGPAIVSLFRALFGDFDLDEVMNQSSGYMNALLFLVYLFVAIFIMLSLFLAILAEAQAAVREREAIKKVDDPNFNEFGVMHTCWDFLGFGYRRVRQAQIRV